MNNLVKEIGVIGTICLDQIYPYKSDKITGLGGIYYSLAALSHLFGESAYIYPFVHVGSDLSPRLPSIFRKYPNIDMNGFIKVSRLNNRVTNRYYSPSERDEFSTFVPPPLRVEEIDCCRTYDMFYINFISGKEMRISTLASLRKKLSCPIYIDIHALVMGFREGGSRFFRRPPKWKEFITCGNIIQMNDNEAKVLGGFSKDDFESYRMFGLHLLDIGPRIILITLGEKGSILFYRKGRKRFDVPIEPYTIGRVREVTGCGDVYAGGFILKYLETNDPAASAKFASRVAGIKAGYKGSQNLYRIRRHLAS